MGPTIKLGFAQKVALRYKKVNPNKKSQILDEFCATFDCHRKYSTRESLAFPNYGRSLPEPITRTPTSPRNLSSALKSKIKAIRKRLWNFKRQSRRIITPRKYASRQEASPKARTPRRSSNTRKPFRDLFSRTLLC